MSKTEAKIMSKSEATCRSFAIYNFAQSFVRQDS